MQKGRPASIPPEAYGKVFMLDAQGYGYRRIAEFLEGQGVFIEEMLWASPEPRSMNGEHYSWDSVRRSEVTVHQLEHMLRCVQGLTMWTGPIRIVTIPIMARIFISYRRHLRDYL